MPTNLPPRHDRIPNPEFRPVVIAAILLVSVLGLVCDKFLPPMAGYALAPSVNDLQLSP
jgi:hypothetical protein